LFLIRRDKVTRRHLGIPSIRHQEKMDIGPQEASMTRRHPGVG